MIKKGMVAGHFLVIPIVETMIGDSKSRRREDVKEFSAMASKLKNDDGSSVFKAWPLGQLLADEYSYDFEKLTEATNASKWSKEMLEEYKKQMSGTKWTPQDPNFVWLNQRSGADAWVPTLSWRPSLPDDE